MPTLAGKACTRDQVRATVRLLDYYRRFLRSDCTHCKDPEDIPCWASTMTRDQVRRRLGFLVNVAINRKAGIPDVACRKQESDYQWPLRRECREIRDWFAHRIVPNGLNGRRFQTPELQRRYGALLTAIHEDHHDY